MDPVVYSATDGSIRSRFEIVLEIPPPPHINASSEKYCSLLLDAKEKEQVTTNETEASKYVQCQSIYYKWIGTTLYCTLFVLYTVYLGFSVNHDVKGSTFLLVVLICWILVLTKRAISGLTNTLQICVKKLALFLKRHPKIVTWTTR